MNMGDPLFTVTNVQGCPTPLKWIGPEVAPAPGADYIADETGLPILSEEEISGKPSQKQIYEEQ